MERILDLGCLMELTEISIAGETSWTLGFDAFGPEEDVDAILVGCVTELLEDYPGPELTADRSHGYPKWLLDALLDPDPLVGQGPSATPRATLAVGGATFMAFGTKSQEAGAGPTLAQSTIKPPPSALTPAVTVRAAALTSGTAGDAEILVALDRATSPLLLPDALGLIAHVDGEWMPLPARESECAGAVDAIISTVAGNATVAVAVRRAKHQEDFSGAAGTHYSIGPLKIVASQPVSVRRLSLIPSRLSVVLDGSVAVPGLVLAVSGVPPRSQLVVRDETSRQVITPQPDGSFRFPAPVSGRRVSSTYYLGVR
ncbi:MAG: hypothetical protein GY769_02635 [bacterium]|nr:hypothetical protein [bacterium]